MTLRDGKKKRELKFMWVQKYSPPCTEILLHCKVVFVSCIILLGIYLCVPNAHKRGGGEMRGSLTPGTRLPAFNPGRDLIKHNVSPFSELNIFLIHIYNLTVSFQSYFLFHSIGFSALLHHILATMHIASS